MIEAFLNERSLHSQFNGLSDLSEALIKVNRILARFVQADMPKRFLWDGSLFSANAIGTYLFSASFVKIPNLSARLQFKLLTEKLNATQWRTERVHLDLTYYWEGSDFRGSSIAELAERTLAGSEGLLFNFEKSKFPNNAISIVINSADCVEIDSTDSQEGLEKWFRARPELGVAIYTADPSRVLQDKETILSNRGRFQRTSRLNKGKVVYLERSTGLYWCLDSFHTHGAHFEVFDANGGHYGEADLTGKIDTSQRDGNKSITI